MSQDRPTTPSSEGFNVIREYHRLLVREWDKAYGRPCAVPLPTDVEQAALVELCALILGLGDPAAEDRAEVEAMRSALKWIAGQERYTFAECSLAEEIIGRARNALNAAPHVPPATCKKCGRIEGRHFYGCELFGKSSSSETKASTSVICEKTGVPCEATHLCHFPNCQDGTPSSAKEFGWTDAANVVLERRDKTVMSKYITAEECKAARQALWEAACDLEDRNRTDSAGGA